MEQSTDAKIDRDRCDAIKRNGQPCLRKTTYGDKCGYHKPDGYHKNHAIQPPIDYNLSEQLNKLSLENNELRLQLDKIHHKLNKLIKKSRR
ncbi:hypothetical protein G6F27_014276 [Rhizopus arrhizus]|nr:hypothetical protein G6F27_014276 [Rhizopus arrhizus]